MVRLWRESGTEYDVNAGSKNLTGVICWSDKLTCFLVVASKDKDISQ